jgi:uncharacterized protein YecE (DUF72 family)
MYKHWRGLFYPEKLAVKRWFAFHAKEFGTVKINNSFYTQTLRAMLRQAGVQRMSSQEKLEAVS